MTDDKPKRGRPRKYGARTNLGIRVSKELHAQLVAATEVSGRKLGEEIVARLLQSFDREALLADVREAVKPTRPQPEVTEALSWTFENGSWCRDKPLKNGYLPS